MTQLYAVVKTLNGGWDTEAKEMKERFEVGDMFEVDSIDIGGWHTVVFDTDGTSYNSVFFEFMVDGKEYDIHANELKLDCISRSGLIVINTKAK